MLHPRTNRQVGAQQPQVGRRTAAVVLQARTLQVVPRKSCSRELKVLSFCRVVSLC